MTARNEPLSVACPIPATNGTSIPLLGYGGGDGSTRQCRLTDGLPGTRFHRAQMDALRGRPSEIRLVASRQSRSSVAGVLAPPS